MFAVCSHSGKQLLQTGNRNMELLRSQPQQGQHGRMEVIGVDSILDAIESDVVGSADHFAPFDPAPRQQSIDLAGPPEGKGRILSRDS
jgi:hypothetical protein